MARVYFRWMGTYWSCTEDAWEGLQHCAANNKPFNLYAFSCRELKGKPRGKVHELIEADVRRTSEDQ